MTADVDAGREQEVQLACEDALLEGTLSVPAGALGIAVCGEADADARLSLRSRTLARMLRQARLATLLVDLVTPEEVHFDGEDSLFPFDVQLLAERLIRAAQWLGERVDTRGLALGCMGPGTAAAGALIAAARRPELVRAVVGFGGRPDLAGDALALVQAPTLLIAPAGEPALERVNRDALARIDAEKRLHVVPGATASFEEPGALEAVAGAAGEWLVGALAPAASGLARLTRSRRGAPGARM